MIVGTLIAESIRAGAELAGIRLVATKISRAAVGDVSAGQPELWTLIEFEAPEDDTEVLAEALATALEQRHGWYADFRTPQETFVVYSGRVFRYPPGIAGDGPRPRLMAAPMAFPSMSSTGPCRHHRRWSDGGMMAGCAS